MIFRLVFARAHRQLERRNVSRLFLAVNSLSPISNSNCPDKSTIAPRCRSLYTKAKGNKKWHKVRNGNLAQPQSRGNKIMFQSLGCPRNWVDTEVMLGIMLQAGYEPTLDLSDADYLVLNTCGFLKEARDESKSEIENFISKKKKSSKLIVTGCMVNLYRDEIIKEYPQIDYVLGSGDVDKILQTIKHGETEEEKAAGLSSSPRSFLENGDVPRVVATPKHYAYLKIAEGCRKRCSFCIIPKIKGQLRSKPEHQIISECKSLLRSGVKEIILIAQDLGDYAKDLQGQHRGSNLSSLLKNILSSIDNEDLWLRLLYLYPDEITKELIDIIKSDTRVCRYVDMPIQHINNDILKRMKRRTSSADVMHTILMLREELPGIHIRTSLMVGFPGETDEQFEELIEFVKLAKLENVGTFIYSNEELAQSYRLDGQVPENVKIERYSRLMEVQRQIVLERNHQKVKEKQVYDVVIDHCIPQTDGGTLTFAGRYYGQCPEVDGQVIINKINDLHSPPLLGHRYKVEITDYCEYDLIAQIVA